MTDNAISKSIDKQLAEIRKLKEENEELYQELNSTRAQANQYKKRHQQYYKMFMDKEQECNALRNELVGFRKDPLMKEVKLLRAKTRVLQQQAKEYIKIQEQQDS